MRTPLMKPNKIVIITLSPTFFHRSPPGQALMIGDDLVNDVGGAQRCGIKGVQVRTGKYRLVNVPSSHSHALLK